MYIFTHIYTYLYILIHLQTTLRAEKIMNSPKVQIFWNKPTVPFISEQPYKLFQLFLNNRPYTGPKPALFRPYNLIHISKQPYDLSLYIYIYIILKNSTISHNMSYIKPVIFSFSLKQIFLTTLKSQIFLTTL